jgi:GT2 family glycosyltransferase
VKLAAAAGAVHASGGGPLPGSATARSQPPATSSTPKVTAIVPARRLDDHGRRCVARLLAFGNAVEVIFVSDEDAPDLDPRATLVVSGAVSVGRKRQQALELARGGYVALIDDDAYPGAEWLRSVVEALERDPQVGAACGPTLTPVEDSELEQLSGRVYASPVVAGPHRWRYARVAPRDVEDAPSVNLVIRREDALAIGLDTDFHPGDDTIICDRLTRRGRRIRYVPGAVVYHSRRPLWRPHLVQVWRFGRHRGAFARTYRGNSLRPSYFAPTALLLLAIAGLLPSRSRPAWRAAMRGYFALVVAAAADLDPRKWARVTLAIPATHLTYGTGFLLGFLGVPLPEDAAARRVGQGTRPRGG